MATLKSFEDIQAWQQARALSKVIFDLANNGAFSKDYSLKDQINRSSGSIMDNIAEGFERDGNKEFMLFLSYAKGSAGEVRSQLYRALDRGYISTEEHCKISDQILTISKMLSSLITYLKQTELKGRKYAQEPEITYQSSATNYETINLEPGT